MAACLRILVPDDTTNYVLNPALRYDTTGWNAFNSTISRVVTHARFNIASLKVVTNGIALREGTYYRVNALQGISEPVTVSAYVRGAGKVHIRLIDNPAGKEWISDPITLRSDRWIRASVTGFSTASNDVRLYIETDGSVQAITFYVDGAQMERKAYATTYCDGDQPGCRWGIVSHASLSTRPVYTRQGGKWVEIGGPCRENDDIYFTVVGGLGSASMINNNQQWPKDAGGYYDNTKVISRIITLSFFVKHKNYPFRGKPSFSALHELRQSLIDVFKSDLTMNEPFLLEYTSADRPVYIRARYEGGLEGEWDVRNQWINSFPIRLIAEDPFIYEDDREVAVLDFQDWTYFNGVAGRIDGRWNRMNYGVLPNAGTADGPVIDFEWGSRGELWTCGSFRFANGNAGAIDPMITPEGITYWDGTKWIKVSAGANGTINDMAVGWNGYLYVTGNFTSIGGVAANGVAYWNGSAWAAMGTGISGVGGATQGLCLTIAPNGNVYLGGNFTSVGGKNCRYCARWDGSMWHTLGRQGGFDAAVNSIVVAADGTYVYFAGEFQNEYGLAGNLMRRVASMVTTTYYFSAMCNGLDNSVYEVIIDTNNGKIYACGAFDIIGSTGMSSKGIAVWNGSEWTQLGSGANGSINSIAVCPNGDVVAVGQFTQIGGVNAKGVGIWNGTSWVPLDIVIAVGATPTMSAVQVLPNGDIFLGGTSFSTTQTKPSIFSGITMVTNSGSAEVRPVFCITGPGRLRWIENQTTGRRMFFDLYVYPYEDVFIDCQNGTIISPTRGLMMWAILPGSDIHALTLLPGENKIAAFISEDVGAALSVYYEPKHWSGDAVATPEAL